MISDDDLDLAAGYIRQLLECLTTLEPIPHQGRTMSGGSGQWIHPWCGDDEDEVVSPPGWLAKKSATCPRCGEMIEKDSDADKVYRRSGDYPVLGKT